MVLLITGSREWMNRSLVRRLLRQVNPSVVVHGACRGADLITEAICKELEINYRGFPAKWHLHGKPAGHIRNKEMLDANPDISLVLALHEDLPHAKGTGNMVKLARERGLKVLAYKPTGELWAE